MNIQRAVLVACACLATVTTLALGDGLLRNWQERSESIALRQSIGAQSALSQATMLLALERSITQVGVNLPSPLPQTFRDMLDAQRVKVDERFTKLMTEIERLDGGGPVVERMEGLMTGLAELRSQADAALGLPAEARMASALALPGQMMATIEELEGLADVLQAKAATPLDVEIKREIQEYSWRMREYGGRERTLFAIALANGAPISPEHMALIADYGRTVDAAWSDMQLLAVRAKQNEALEAAIAEAEQVYLQRYGELKQALLAAGPGLYPMDFNTFFAQSTEALNALEALNITAGEAALEVAERRQSAATRNFVLQAALALGTLGALAWGMHYALRNVSGRLLRLAQTMEHLARGELDADPKGLDGRDEIGAMARAVGVFRENALRVRRLEEEAASQRERAEAEKQATITRLAAEFEAEVLGAVDTVASQARRLEDAATALERTANASIERADSVARTATESSTSVQSAASASEEMAAAASEIGQRVAHATDVARTAEHRAQDADQTMRELAAAAGRIGEIVTLISQIASQTNLLALNATIEAARAGDSGRGFAVVASEVKRLAEQTARATEDISNQVRGIQSIASEAERSLQMITSTIREINEISTSISRSVSEQGSALGEISSSTARVAMGATAVSEAVVEVRQGAAATGAAAAGSLDAARALGAEAERLRAAVAQFTTRLRAA